jgi:hypothetical protein
MKFNQVFGTVLGVLALMVFTGCGPSAQDLYDEAARQVKLQQERLDNLRPAYDAARQKAILAVTRELAGATPDENAQNALKQLEGISASVGGTDLLAGSNQDQLDAAIDHMTKMQSAIESQQSTLLGGVVKINETMKNIETPGTPENKRFEEMLAAMPEVQAFRRQENRLEEATKTMLEAEKALDAAAK